MTHPILERRRAEQKKRIDLADAYVRVVARGLDIVQA
jgi:hypothetical protein